jgi:hypothetical protein
MIPTRARMELMVTTILKKTNAIPLGAVTKRTGLMVMVAGELSSNAGRMVIISILIEIALEPATTLKRIA